jgi:hypothetical protein
MLWAVKAVVLALRCLSDHAVSNFAAVYKHQSRRCPKASSAAALTSLSLFCVAPQRLQSAALSIFLFRCLFTPFWLQVQKEATFFTKYCTSFVSQVFIARRSSSSTKRKSTILLRLSVRSQGTRGFYKRRHLLRSGAVLFCCDSCQISSVMLQLL